MNNIKLLISSGPLVGLAAFLFFANAEADTIVAQDEELIYLSNGRVEFVSEQVGKLSKRIEPGIIPKANFDPSILNHLKEAHEIYQRMRDDYHEKAECTNMAHVWSYEEFKETGIKTQKMFLFFTRKYILKYRFPWWFHVSPMVMVKESQVILDRRYTTLPLDPKTWTEHFVLSGKACREIKKFSTFWNRKHSIDDCFLMTGTMYDWQPRDLRLKEQGKIKKSFRQSDLKQAYKQAF